MYTSILIKTITIMETNRKLCVIARSNLDTVITISININDSVTDLTEHIYSILSKIQSYNNKLERFKIEHIESVKK